MTKGKRAGDGPLAVEVEKGKSYYWSACGQSKKQPFCDGSHMSPLNDEGTKFTPFAYKAEETKKGTRLNQIMRHTLGLFHGQTGSSFWKRYLSENMCVRDADVQKIDHIMNKIKFNNLNRPVG